MCVHEYFQYCIERIIRVQNALEFPHTFFQSYAVRVYCPFIYTRIHTAIYKSILTYTCTHIYTYIHTYIYVLIYFHEAKCSVYTHIQQVSINRCINACQSVLCEITHVCSALLIKPTSCSICCQAGSTRGLINICVYRNYLNEWWNICMSYCVSLVTRAFACEILYKIACVLLFILWHSKKKKLFCKNVNTVFPLQNKPCFRQARKHHRVCFRIIGSLREFVAIPVAAVSEV